MSYDPANNPDRTVHALRRGAEFIPWPDEYPQDGKDVSIASYHDKLVCAHPEHPPYVLRTDNTWEKLSPGYYALIKWDF